MRGTQRWRPPDTEKVTHGQVKSRLIAHREEYGPGPHRLSELAAAIWQTRTFVTDQGAALAAGGVVRTVGGYRVSSGYFLDRIEAEE